MRVTVLGGTRFIGRRIVSDLAARGDEVQVVHRGETEPPDLPPVTHLHADRSGFAGAAAQVVAFEPDAIVDTCAMSRADADGVLPYLPDVPIVLLSSMNVYAAFGLVVTGTGESEPVPLSETSRLREGPLAYSDGAERSYQDKLEVEPSYLERGATVLRLAMIYGEHDRQRREEFVLRRVRAGRTRIPIGSGTWLWTRAYVGDVSAAVLAGLDDPRVAGEVLNIGEPVTRSMKGWTSEILAAAGHDAELVHVPEAVVPEDLWITKRIDQHALFDCGKAVRRLDWHPDPAAGLSRSVAWHLAHSPADASTDFTGDDAALSAA